ncbi:MAG: GtrA family protein, partial [Geodermatophilaceae bacterium]|nr:GtrA family protein [Geodermatophilaceae bacterium]
TLVANELHRRLTFRASAAVGWLRAQLQGGGYAALRAWVFAAAQTRGRARLTHNPGCETEVQRA